MDRIREESLGDVLRRSLEENRLSARLDELKALEMWKRMMGPAITALCSGMHVANGMITVYIQSAPLRNELSMRRSDMTALINSKFGRQVIKEIKFK